ncbi:MAG: chromatin modification- protein VID21 [Watsoniomyces obsoletus]|nr:MAG: chromatin modification- protein VID21 [Watsoniomyces obsoletus]
MGKRKRVTREEEVRKVPNGRRETAKPFQLPSSTAAKESEESAAIAPHDERTVMLQIVVGSYERILHGLTARIHTADDVPQARKKRRVDFADTFLFHAHASAIRCLAVSPMQAGEGGSGTRRVILASGSTDERINLYQLSASPPGPDESDPLRPTLGNHPVVENRKNRELGSLLHHSACVTRLCFPTRSKLLSSAEDNTIAVTRTRDWTALSAIKAPLPRAHGRPSGDTAPAGAGPAGINDFAVHPSRKVMLSVSRGERCMRLWNLMTGKKAGVLKFDKELMQTLGEGKWSGGEGRTLDWNVAGEEFVVGFERGAVVYSMDCKPKCRVIPVPATNVHQIRYLQRPGSSSDPHAGKDAECLLAVSTEDGRIIFYSSAHHHDEDIDASTSRTAIAEATVLGEMGGKAMNMPGRIKDFLIIPWITNKDDHEDDHLLVVTGSSDGLVRLWEVLVTELLNKSAKTSTKKVPDRTTTIAESNGQPQSASASARQVGHLLGTYETNLRITCLTGFAMARSESQAHEEAREGDANRGTSDNEAVHDDEEEEEVVEEKVEEDGSIKA